MSNESADDQLQQQYQVKPRPFMMNRPNYAWEDGSGMTAQGATNSMPRSPLAHDRSNTFSSQRAKTSVSDHYGRRSVATTYAGLPAPRSASNRQPKDRSVSVAVGRPRSPYTSTFRFFLTVIPPADLPQDPPHPRSQASAISTSHTRRGTLLPLYPTLGGQLYAISREYGLPSIGGISLYLCDDGEGNLGPRVGDAAWSALWNRYFDDASEDLYQDITSPMPSRSIFREQNHDRHHSGSSGEVPSPFADRSSHLRREVESGNYDDATFLRYELERRTSSSAAARLPPFASGYPASPSAAYHTPSPRYAKGNRTNSRSSPYTPSNTQARLPIVGRIEWAIDKKRAPWWSNWIGEAEMASEKSISHIQAPIVEASNAKDVKPGRRSMHLRTDLLPRRATSPLRTVPIQGDYDEATENGNESYKESHFASQSQSQNNSREDLRVMGYEPIRAEDQTDYARSQEEEATYSDSVKQNVKMGENSHDTQSYAGYSALLDVDEEAQTREEESTRYGDNDRDPSHFSFNRHEANDHFNVNMLQENDESEWRRLGHDIVPLQSRDRNLESAVNGLNQVRDAIGETSAVQEWIVKTQSPRSNDRSAGYLEVEDGEDEEALLSPQDDVEEVLGLWAEKVGNREGSLLPDLSNETQEDMTVGKEGRNAIHHSHTSSLTASNYSVERTSPRSNRQFQQDDNEYADIVRMGEVPDSAPDGNSKGASINKASLLSPIALDGASTGTFAGPSANLGSLLPTRNNNLLPNLEIHQSTFDKVTSSSAKSVTTQFKEALPVKQHSPSSPRLEIPDPHSPGAHSDCSSVTDVSDTLADMERALELLSPSLSNNNHHGSPAVNTADTTYEAGSMTSFSRSKMPYVSSRESMARAKTLSTSVTPSPRWFRNGNGAFNSSTSHTAIAALHARMGSANEDPSEHEDAHHTSTRPVSASATIENQVEGDSWQVQSSPDDKHQHTKMGEADPQVNSSIKISHSTSGTIESDRRLCDSDGCLSEIAGDVIRREVEDEIKTKGEVQEENKEPEKISTARQPQLFMDEGSVRLYGSPIEIEGERLQLLHPGEHLGRQGWSDSTIDNSARQIPSQLSSQMPPSSLSETGDDFLIQKGKKDNHNRLQSIDAMFSPRSGEYATVGVQAEREEGSRTNSLFSLVSDGAAPSTMSGSHRGMDMEDDTIDTTMAMNEEVKSRVQSLSTAELTPVIAARAEMSQQFSPGKEEEQPSIQRLLRGNSFAASSVASSKAASVMSPDESERESLDWRVTGRPNSTTRAANDGIVPQASKLYQMMTQEGEGEDDSDHYTAKANVEENEEFTRTIKALSESDSGNGGEWTYDGSEYDENKFDTEEYEGGVTSDSPATTRISRMSAYSHSMPLNGAGVSDAGGRTPTFFYDQHLADDDDMDAVNSNRHRLSKDSRAYQESSQKRHEPSSLGPEPDQHSLEPRSWHLYNQQSPVKARKNTIKGPTTSDALDGDSYDSSRHDIISMQGEPLNSSDDQMLKGFEQVSPTSAELHHPITGLFANNASNKIGTKSEDSASSLTETAISLSPFPTQQQSPQTPSLQFDQPDAILTRRSLGSAVDNSKGVMERDPSPLRRASGSVTSPYTRSASFTTSPRRFKGAMLRLASNMSNTSSNNGQTTISSRGNSPNQRFGALPPSPSLPGLGSAGIMMSPTHSYSGTRSTSGGTLHSPILTSTFITRNGTSPPYDKIDGIPPSPAFKFPRTAGTLTPPSPNRLTRQTPLAKNSNIINTTFSS